MFIPYAWIFAFGRIEKLRKGLVLFGISIGVSIGLSMVLPFPYNLFASLAVTILIPVRFIRKWSRAWNESLITKNESRESDNMEN